MIIGTDNGCGLAVPAAVPFGGEKMLTAEELGALLFEEFERDDWGMIDPGAFANPQGAETKGEMRGLKEVLERVTDRINRIILLEAKTDNEKRKIK
jgi:hypothetical protein